MKASSLYMSLIFVALVDTSGAKPAQGASSRPSASAKPAGQTISARWDNTGQHPGSAAVSGPTKVKCLTASSNITNPQPKPTCNITGPGINGEFNPGQEGGTSGAGTVTLNCDGQGDVLTCSARVGG